MDTRKIGMGALGLAMVVGSLVGCGKVSEKASEKITEKALEQAGGGDVKVDIDKDTGEASISGTDSKGNKTEFSLGSTDLPENWPKELSIPDGFSVMTSNTMALGEGGMNTVIAGGKGDVKKLVGAYKKDLSKAGYEVLSENSTTQGDTAMKMLTVKKELTSITINVSTSPEEDPPTTLYLRVTTEVKE